jgi:hypothetical protein
MRYPIRCETPLPRASKLRSAGALEHDFYVANRACCVHTLRHQQDTTVFTQTHRVKMCLCLWSTSDCHCTRRETCRYGGSEKLEAIKRAIDAADDVAEE